MRPRAEFNSDSLGCVDFSAAVKGSGGASAAEAEAFYAEVRRYWPALPDGALQPAYAGVRPKGAIEPIPTGHPTGFARRAC